MTIQSNFPAIKPSLLLDFANTKQLDPRITFTRASTATYYDGVTTAMAEQNLLLNSQIIGSTNWTNNSSTATINNTSAPDSTTTASLFTATAGTGLIPRTVTTTTNGSAGTVTYSVYAKAGTYSYLQLYVSSQSDYANFDLTLGIVGTKYVSSTSTITSVGSGWYRCSITFTLAASANSVQMSFAASASATFAQAWNPAGTETVFLWGAQLEQRSAVTAYTATTTQAITNYIPVLQTAASGVARFDHNPTTDESLGLLIEEQRTNLVIYSALFYSNWSTNAASAQVAATISPEGALTAQKIIPNSTSGTHGVYRSVSVSASTVYTQSVYAKAGEYSWLYMTEGNSVTASAFFNLSTGVVGVVSGTGSPSATITSVGNGWYRCTLTFTTIGGQSLANIQVRVASGDNSATFTGNDFNGIYAWGAQIEAGAFATSYIATTSSQVTRSADAASMTGTNFSSWYSAGEGTVYFESQTAQGTNSYAYSLFGTSTSNRIFANYNSSLRMNSGVRVNGTFEASVNTPNSTAPLNTFGKGATAYKVNDFGFSWNGDTALTDTSTTLPIVLQLDIGNNNGTATNFLNGTIRKIAYYPLRVTNAQLQALTS